MGKRDAWVGVFCGGGGGLCVSSPVGVRILFVDYELLVEAGWLKKNDSRYKLVLLGSSNCAGILVR